MKDVICPLCNGTGAYKPLPTGSSLSWVEENKEMRKKMILDFLKIIKGDIKMLEFKIGDVVKLKSSDLKMTVAAINVGINKDEINCTWFDADCKFREGWFKKETLEAV